MTAILLVGDRDDAVLAHRAIDASLRMLRERAFPQLAWEWPGTEALARDASAILPRADGVWCVPASPYRSAEGALAAIRYAREHDVPFLGTCGGFQHALLEYARNVLGLAAEHEEEAPDAALRLLSRMACSLVEVEAQILLEPDSRAARIVGKSRLVEGFHCNFGLNPEYRQVFDGSSLRVAGTDELGDVRVVELEHHRFFIATLFQPERRALTRGEPHPLVRAFVQAAQERGPDANAPDPISGPKAG